MIRKLSALKNVVELTEDKVGLETINELIYEAKQLQEKSKKVVDLFPKEINYVIMKNESMADFQTAIAELHETVYN